MTDPKEFKENIANLQAESHARAVAAQDDDILEDDNATRVWATKSRSKLYEQHLDEDFTFSILDKLESKSVKHGLHLLKQVRIFEMDKKTGLPMKGGFGDLLEHNLRTTAIVSRAKDGRTQDALLTKQKISKYEYDLHEKNKNRLGIPGGS